jgi:aminoglycoside phosphotransferase family enzyme/predicted kinase
MHDPQGEVLRALESGAATGDSGPLRRIDTHISYVFLGRGRAYKLKRAVRLPFVDFSTLEQRRAACEAELAIDRRFAPGLYLGVEPIVRAADGGLKIGAPGEALDWLVVMRRFEDGALFDELARAGRLTEAMVGEAAAAVAAFHAAAEPVLGAGHPRRYIDIVHGLRRAEADGAAAHGLKACSPVLHDALAAEAGRAALLVDRRRRAGKVRRGHGDLHLRNLCLHEGRSLAFDALEFDAALATADVLYDLAFLLMDLVHHGLRGHANHAMNRYFDAAGEDEAGLALLPFFMALRAGVRAAVATEAGEADEADGYRRLGLRLLEPVEPRLVAVGGLSGSGKSALARVLAPELGGPCGARLLRTDVIRKAGRPEDQPLGAEAYAAERRTEVYRALAERAGEALGAGVSALADATFRDPEARLAITLAAGGSRFDALWLEAPLEVRLARIGARSGDASDADARIAAAQAEPELEHGWSLIDASGAPDDVAAAARHVLGA